jgi:hypothetical protein
MEVKLHAFKTSGPDDTFVGSVINFKLGFVDNYTKSYLDQSFLHILRILLNVLNL